MNAIIAEWALRPTGHPHPAPCDILPPALELGVCRPKHLSELRPPSSGALESSCMSRRFVNQLAHQEAVDQIFLASQKQLRPNRNGNLYLQVELSDRSGSISARMWNASEQDYRNFDERRFRPRRGHDAALSGRDAADRHQHLQGPHERGRTRPISCRSAPGEIDRLAVRLGELLRGMPQPAPAEPGRVLSDGRRVHDASSAVAGRREEPSRLHRRAAGARRQPDGGRHARRPAAIRRSTPTCC